jgi:hypothetical protein
MHEEAFMDVYIRAFHQLTLEQNAITRKFKVVRKCHRNCMKASKPAGISKGLL